MPEPLEARIRVVSSDETGQIADTTPAKFREPDLDKITSITNQFVVHLQNNLTVASQENPTSNSLSLSEVELTFGIDFEAEGSADIRIPLIGPVVRGGIRGGATFEVHIKLSRGNAS